MTNQLSRSEAHWEDLESQRDYWKRRTRDMEASMATIAEMIDASKDDEVATLKHVLEVRDQALDAIGRWRLFATRVCALYERDLLGEIEELTDEHGRTHAKAAEDREALEQRLADVKDRSGEQGSAGQ